MFSLMAAQTAKNIPRTYIGVEKRLPPFALLRPASPPNSSYHVRKYLLFVDTETSGIPQDWNQPYSVEGNWPYILQVAWIIYTHDGKEVKTENHYLRPDNYAITPESGSVHGLTMQFLRDNGQDRRDIMQRLQTDLQEYEPLVVAHFMQLDFHMMGVGFHRSGLTNPLPGLPTFCTMLFTERLLRPAGERYLRLADLYQRLFHESLHRQHDALVDAYATARCFFRLREQGAINDRTIAAQQARALPGIARKPRRLAGWLLLAIAVLLGLLLRWKL